MLLIPEWLSRFLSADAYLLRLPPGCSVIKHKDPVDPGHKHYRMNITVWRESYKERMYILGPMKRWGRIEIFRPDLYEHGMQPITDWMFMFSFGIRIKE